MKLMLLFIKSLVCYLVTENYQPFSSKMTNKELCYIYGKYRNFRSFTRTGRLLHTAKKKVTRLPALVYNPHVVIQIFGGENVTLR